MGSSVVVRRLVLTGLVGLLVAGGAQVASAHRTALSVEIVSEQASLAPDGGSMTFDLSTVCDRGWTIVEASVSVTQPQASGTGSFTPNCGRIPYVVRVTVPATSGTFQTGPAEATAVLFVQEGPTKRAQDSATLRVRPDVSVVLADQAVLEGDGAVRIEVTLTCPMSAVGRHCCIGGSQLVAEPFGRAGVQITRASSANASARREVSGASVPRS